jgi:hypothetical protein
MYYLAVGLVVVLVITLILLLISYYKLAGEHQKNTMIASYAFIGVSILLSTYMICDVQSLYTKLDNKTTAYNMTKHNCDKLLSNPQDGNLDFTLLEQALTKSEALIQSNEKIRQEQVNKLKGDLLECKLENNMDIPPKPPQNPVHTTFGGF